MDLQQRRRVLVTRSNPGAHLDYVVSLDGTVTGEGLQAAVRIRYVPDKLVLEPTSLGAYLDALGTMTWESLEQAAVAILEDFSNEVVARWVQVAVSAPGAMAPGIDNHGVLLEDRQPRWDNAALLSRLRRY